MNRIWSQVGKVLGSLFLLAGGTVTTGFMVGIVLSHASGGLLGLFAALMVMFGLGPIVLGGWILQSSFQAERQALRERFYQMLLANQGRLSVLDFATSARLEPTIARRHLDGWAKECCATFEVNERGDIYYVFAMEQFALPSSTNGQAIKQAIKQTIRQWLQAV
jgi:hypothetical protein